MRLNLNLRSKVSIIKWPVKPATLNASEFEQLSDAPSSDNLTELRSAYEHHTNELLLF
ncbi:MAG: hypothetical protein HRU09_00050 [Oligoflexales bacterium]|nr:hypothetical protein [Oligoflexales bacterium]